MLYLNGHKVPAHTFPNHEIYLESGPLIPASPSNPCTIQLRFEGNDDLIGLMLLKKQLEDRGVFEVSLFVPFFPYSTMDHTDDSRPLSLKYVVEWINGLNFHSVEVLEPHSMVLPALLNRASFDYYTLHLLHRAIGELPSEKLPVICFPDLGAEKRYRERLALPYHTLTFQKTRNFATGAITGMRCMDALPEKNPNHVFFLVDDLCRGGRTFIQCAQVLREMGASQIILCVTHLEAGAFQGVLQESSPVDLVYATNSCLPDHIPAAPKLRLDPIFQQNG